MFTKKNTYYTSRKILISYYVFLVVIPYILLSVAQVFFYINSIKKMCIRDRYITREALKIQAFEAFLSVPGNQGIGYIPEAVDMVQILSAVQNCIAQAYHFFIQQDCRICRETEERRAARWLGEVQRNVQDNKWDIVCEQLSDIEENHIPDFTVRSAVKLCNIIFTGNLFQEEETDYYIYGIRCV